MINKDLMIFLVGGDSNNYNQTVSLTVENDGDFGEIDYLNTLSTNLHIINNTIYKIDISKIFFEGKDYERFICGTLSKNTLNPNEETIVELTFDPNDAQPDFYKNYYAKISVLQYNNKIVTYPLTGIGIVLSYDCGMDLTNDQIIDCGGDAKTNDSFDAGITPD